MLLLRASVLCFAVGSSGCGVILQSALGWNDVETTRTTEKHSVNVTSMPEGAMITRKDPNGAVVDLGGAPLVDSVTYDVEVITEKPKVVGLAIGGILETALGIALIATNRGQEGSVIGGAYIIGLAGLPELITALVLGLSGDTVKERRTIPETQSYTYRAKLGDFPEVAKQLRAPEQAKLELLLDPSAAPVEVKEEAPAIVKFEPPQPLVIEDMHAAAQSWVIAVPEVEGLGDRLRSSIAGQGVQTAESVASGVSHQLQARLARFGERCVLSSELVDLRARVTIAASSSQGACEAESYQRMSDEVARRLVGPR